MKDIVGETEIEGFWEEVYIMTEVYMSRRCLAIYNII
jgi:hypothetical protein